MRLLRVFKNQTNKHYKLCLYLMNIQSDWGATRSYRWPHPWYCDLLTGLGSVACRVVFCSLSWIPIMFLSFSQFVEMPSVPFGLEATVLAAWNRLRNKKMSNLFHSFMKFHIHSFNVHLTFSEVIQRITYWELTKPIRVDRIRLGRCIYAGLTSTWERWSSIWTWRYHCWNVQCRLIGDILI